MFNDKHTLQNALSQQAKKKNMQKNNDLSNRTRPTKVGNAELLRITPCVQRF